MLQYWTAATDSQRARTISQPLSRFASATASWLPLLTVAFVTLAAIPVTAASPESSPTWRGPIALAMHGSKLYSANRYAGSISIIDCETEKVVNEVHIGDRLDDLAAVPGSPFLIAADSQTNELILIQVEATGLTVMQRMNLPAKPVDVAISADGSVVTVSCLWARQTAVFRFDPSKLVSDGPRASLEYRLIDVPILPHVQWLSEDGNVLVVADSAMGKLAIVDLVQNRVRSVRSFWGHNVRGMTTSADGKGIILSHLMLNGLVPTVKDRITWGAVVSSVLRTVPLDELLSETPGQQEASKPVEIGRWSMDPLGEPGHAGGDPAAVLQTPSGPTFVCLSGVHELAVRSKSTQPFEKRRSGRLPVSIIADDRLAYVANYGDDSISVIELQTLEVASTIHLGSEPDLTQQQRGELLFYDAHLSHDGWYSCHSCHTDGHTNEMLSDNLTDGSYGAPKRVPTLLGVGTTGPWGWVGSSSSLPAQMHLSIVQTMHGPEKAASQRNAEDLTAYLQTLGPPPSIAAARAVNTSSLAVARGKQVFEQAGCIDCHAAPDYTAADVFDVGLSDQVGNRMFNPPSLLGLGQRRAFLHDGRATSIADVFEHHQSEDWKALNEQQRSDLMTFLRSL